MMCLPCIACAKKNNCAKVLAGLENALRKRGIAIVVTRNECLSGVLDTVSMSHAGRLTIRTILKSGLIVKKFGGYLADGQ